MNDSGAILFPLVGGALGLLIGSLLWPQDASRPTDQMQVTQPQPVPQPPSENQPAAIRVEARREVAAPSQAAQEALASGNFHVTIQHQDESALLRILGKRAGQLVVQHGTALVRFDNGGRRTEPGAAWLKEFDLNNAWALTCAESARKNGLDVLPGDRLFLVMPWEYSLLLFGEIERRLAEPIANFSSARLAVSRTSGGHLLWTLSSAEHRERGMIRLAAELRGL